MSWANVVLGMGPSQGEKAGLSVFSTLNQCREEMLPDGGSRGVWLGTGISPIPGRGTGDRAGTGRTGVQRNTSGSGSGTTAGVRPSAPTPGRGLNAPSPRPPLLPTQITASPPTTSEIPKAPLMCRCSRDTEALSYQRALAAPSPATTKQYVTVV